MIAPFKTKWVGGFFTPLWSFPVPFAPGLPVWCIAWAADSLFSPPHGFVRRDPFPGELRCNRFSPWISSLSRLLSLPMQSTPSERYVSTLTDVSQLIFAERREKFMWVGQSRTPPSAFWQDPSCATCCADQFLPLWFSCAQDRAQSVIIGEFKVLL